MKKSTKIFSLLFAVCIAVSAFAMPTSAASINVKDSVSVAGVVDDCSNKKISVYFEIPEGLENITGIEVNITTDTNFPITAVSTPLKGWKINTNKTKIILDDGRGATNSDYYLENVATPVNGKYEIATLTIAPTKSAVAGKVNAKITVVDVTAGIESHENSVSTTSSFTYSVNKHSYSNACDKSCNTCGATRSVGSHKYLNDCDKSCNVCGASRSVGSHKYTNSCDTSCNECKATRSISHSYKTTTTKATTSKNGSIVKKCSVCGKVSSTTTIYRIKSVSLSTSTYTYNGKTKKPSVKVKDYKGKTVSSSYYTVSYASGRKSIGKYKVTVTFKGRYSGTKTLYFKINPQKVSSLKLKSSKKKELSVSWKKDSKASGYEIVYATNSKFTKSKKTVKITSYKTYKKTIKKLSSKKTYYVKVRAYKTVKGTKYYGSYCSYKKLKIK